MSQVSSVPRNGAATGAFFMVAASLAFARSASQSGRKSTVRHHKVRGAIEPVRYSRVIYATLSRAYWVGGTPTKRVNATLNALADP